jgi:hypothetical protein
MFLHPPIRYSVMVGFFFTRGNVGKIPSDVNGKLAIKKQRAMSEECRATRYITALSLKPIEAGGGGTQYSSSDRAFA